MLHLLLFCWAAGCTLPPERGVAAVVPWRAAGWQSFQAPGSVKIRSAWLFSPTLLSVSLLSAL